MSEPTVIQPAEPAAPPPLTATLAQIAGKPEFSLAEFRKAREAPPEPVKTEAPAEPAKEPEKVEATAEPVKTEEPAKPDASEAARTLAQHKSGLATRKASIQQEIDALTHDKHATRREIDAAKAELARVQAEIAAAKSEKAPERVPVVDPNDPEPQEEAFEHYRDFVKAQARWEARQEFKAAQQAARQRHVQTQQQQALERVYAKGAEVYPDFEEALTSALDAGVKWSPLVTRVIFTHPQGHALAYALAKDPALSTKLSGIRDPIQFGMDITPVLSGLSPAPVSGPVETPKPKSQAQEPPKPVGTAPTASLPSLESVVGTGTEMSLKRFRQAREAGRR